MEEEEHTNRKQQLAMLHQKLNKIKRYFNEDDTDSINQIIGSNSPETCFTYLKKIEQKADVHLDHNHLTKLLDFYTRVFSSLPLGKYCHNESYAKMLVRFAELKAIQDVNEAEANFDLARSHCTGFAFVHVAQAQFEHSQGNTKKVLSILQRAIALNAKPKEMLEAALQNLQSKKSQLLNPDDKENISVLANNIYHDSAKNGSELQKVCRKSDGTGELQLSSIFSTGMDSSDEQLPVWRSGPQRKRVAGLPGRVPIVPFSIPEMDSDDSGKKPTKTTDAFIPSSLSRQTSGSSTTGLFGISSVKKNFVEGDFLNLKPPTISPEPRPWEEVEPADSTTTLLHRQDKRDSSRMQDITCNFNQILSSNSPESCWTYLLNLEKMGNPHTDSSLRTKLTDCYSKVLSKLPIGKYSKNESYARMLVRYAALKGIEDPEEAQDHFIVARSNSKGFAFVHIAHAQFEVSQGNVRKATSILHKAQSLRAQPSELLNTAMQNLKAGETQLVPSEEAEQPPDNVRKATSILHKAPSFRAQPSELLNLKAGEMQLVLPDETEQPPELRPYGSSSVAAPVESQDFQVPARVNQPVEQPKPASKEPSSGWKVPALLSRYVSPEEKKHITPPEPRPIPRLMEPVPSLPIPSRVNPTTVCQTPNNHRDPYPNSYITPVVRRDPEVAPSASRRPAPSQLPCTPLNQVSYAQTPQGSAAAFSNESITIKGKQFFILKMIGRGGSSKVYQVLDHKKQLFAVKYVNLEEADAQTVESYKNEIEHLNHLQYSDQIIKLYDYEMTNSYIYMLMECGNLDLNTWLRNRKTVNSLERKFYWKNMLDAVQTIHKHGIVHSDLKPANFVIVNATLKLIDFGIANHIQPDVTSIMKDSQVGTLNYMPPEAIKDTSSKPGKATSKISPKGDVWSLGCILYYMTYGKTPFQSITNQLTKLHAIIDPSHEIAFPDIAEKDLLDVLKRCLVRNPRERVSVAELLEHPYLQLQPQKSPEPERPDNSDLRKILNDLAALQSPNSIVRAANNLAKMCNSGRKLDVSECVKSSSQPSWKM